MTTTKVFRTVFALGILVFILSEASKAENAGEIRSGDAWGESQPQRPYEKGSVATVSGKVLSMDNLMVYENGEPGMQLRLDVGGEEVRVQLGPRWFVVPQNLNLTAGQPLTVVGIQINLEGHSTVIAHEVSQGDRSVSLQEEKSK